MADFAKLIRGKNYFLGNKHFTPGKWIKVTPEEKAHLDEHALDPVTVGSGDEVETEYLDKFEFHEGEAAPSDEGEAPVEKTRRRAQKAPARRRTRSN